MCLHHLHHRLHFADVCAVYVEGWVATAPLLPFSFFGVKQMKPFLISLFFSYGSACCLAAVHGSVYGEVYERTPLHVGAWFVPFALGGLVISPVCGLLLHIVPGTFLLVITGTG